MLKLNFHPFPKLTTERLVLRAVTMNDAQDLLVLRSDVDVMRYVPRNLAVSIEEIHAKIRMIEDAWHKNEGIFWVIVEKPHNKLIGTIGYWRIMEEHYRAEVGYLLHPAFQGKGIMFEALQAVMDYGFTQMHLHSIEANIDPLNTASRKLVEKAGFVQEAYFKENFYFNGQFLDSVIYSKLNAQK
jgi:ribosomal-protein-alanine N-acetyltransferase